MNEDINDLHAAFGQIHIQNGGIIRGCWLSVRIPPSTLLTFIGGSGHSCASIVIQGDGTAHGPVITSWNGLPMVR
jgi:hypothetical protein